MAPIMVLPRPRPAGNQGISGTNLTPLPWKSQCWSASWSLSHQDRAAQCWLQHDRTGDTAAPRVGLLTCEHYVRAQLVQQCKNPELVPGGAGN
ncbi:unnamed protein product [Gulo gulo]|uniref:Uncharacterized protein n=1 Tax=Gulo gulo TaxID=48420 RepID=A0A9X9LUU9_GULGU|nr:unnamed protein product [Gulo gulo]